MIIAGLNIDHQRATDNTTHYLYSCVFVCYIFVVRRKNIHFTAQFTLIKAQLIFLHKHVTLYQFACCFASIEFFMCMFSAGWRRTTVSVRGCVCPAVSCTPTTWTSVGRSHWNRPVLPLLER